MMKVQISDSGSSKRPKSNPGSHAPRVWLAPSAAPAVCVATFQESAASTNDAATSAEASQPESVRSCGPKVQQRIAPASGSSQSATTSGYEPGTPSRLCGILAAQRPGVVDVDVPLGAERRHDDRQTRSEEHTSELQSPVH